MFCEIETLLKFPEHFTKQLGGLNPCGSTSGLSVSLCCSLSLSFGNHVVCSCLAYPDVGSARPSGVWDWNGFLVP